jgi:hypothetical protein
MVIVPTLPVLDELAVVERTVDLLLLPLPPSGLEAVSLHVSLLLSLPLL